LFLRGGGVGGSGGGGGLVVVVVVLRILPRSLYTSSGSMGPSPPCWVSVWRRRMGLLHMGHTLRISSHFSRHLQHTVAPRGLGPELEAP